MITTSYLPRRSALKAVALVRMGSASELRVPVEDRVERGLVVVPSGDQQSLRTALGLRPSGAAVPRQLFDVDVLELHEAGRADPVAVLVLAAVVLEGEPAAGGKVGNRGARR